MTSPIRTEYPGLGELPVDDRLGSWSFKVTHGHLGSAAERRVLNRLLTMAQASGCLESAEASAAHVTFRFTSPQCVLTMLGMEGVVLRDGMSWWMAETTVGAR